MKKELYLAAHLESFFEGGAAQGAIDEVEELMAGELALTHHLGQQGVAEVLQLGGMTGLGSYPRLLSIKGAIDRHDVMVVAGDEAFGEE